MSSADNHRIAVITFNDVPAVNPTAKYDRLGSMALANRRQYCARHGYSFVADVPIARDRPACWAKIPAILDAFRTHDWVLWADSDALVAEPAIPLDRFIDPVHDMVVQSHDTFFRHVGIPAEEGRRRMPINAGVFLIKASNWARNFLHNAYRRTEFVTHGAIWDGIGEQEAMIAELQRNPDDLHRIRHVDDLQTAPRFHRPGTLFLHFYGNHAQHHVPAETCAAVIDRWDRTVRAGAPLPDDRILFHWCCIQNRDPHAPAPGGDLRRYFYTHSDLRMA